MLQLRQDPPPCGSDFRPPATWGSGRSLAQGQGQAQGAPRPPRALQSYCRCKASSRKQPRCPGLRGSREAFPSPLMLSHLPNAPALQTFATFKRLSPETPPSLPPLPGSGAPQEVDSPGVPGTLCVPPAQSDPRSVSRALGPIMEGTSPSRSASWQTQAGGQPDRSTDNREVLPPGRSR